MPMRPIDVLHLGRPRVISCWDVDGVLVDPGPESSVDTLLEALGGVEPRALLLTHIHFDHAGAAGALVRRYPSLPVYVHSRGARHLEDPARLVASATRLYGESDFARLWGEVVPVPASNLVALEGGETLLDGDFEVIYTPGHASHHVCYRHVSSGRALVGDMAGVVIPPSELVLAPTPPPDIDLAAWERSLQAISAWEPTALCLTHFGLVSDPPAQFARLRARLAVQAELQRVHDQEGFESALRSLLARETDEETALAYLQATPPDHLYQGLSRWRAKLADQSGEPAAPAG